jgi:hypothetical protein
MTSLFITDCDSCVHSYSNDNGRNCWAINIEVFDVELSELTEERLEQKKQLLGLSMDEDDMEEEYWDCQVRCPLFFRNSSSTAAT